MKRARYGGRSIPRSSWRAAARRSGPWSVFVLAGLALTGGYFLAPDGWPKAVLYDTISLATALAIIVGVRLYRPRRPIAWYALALGQLLFFGGDVLWNVYELVLQESPFPSLADVLYLAGYPALMVGLAIIVRSRLPGGDRGSFLDALIITTGLGLISWIFLIQPYLADSELAPLELAVSIAYPLVDVLLLAVVLRLVAAPGARPTSFWFLVGNLSLTLAADTIFAIQTLDGTFVDHGPLDALWLLSYLLLGASALHPSMRELTSPTGERTEQLSRVRLVFLAGASLVAPAILALQAVDGASPAIAAIAVGSAVSFLLVIARMADLVGGLARSLVQRTSLQQRLEFQAFHDPLTNLANRALFTDRVRHALARRAIGNRAIAVIFLDLDDFKAVNDSLGHAVGDELLIGVARRLERAVRDGDTVARLGGDEFAALIEDLDDSVAAVRTADRVLAAFSSPVKAGGREYFVLGSLGIALGTPGLTSTDEILRNADVAMYQAKRAGTGLVRLFEPAMQNALIERVHLQADLQRAVAEGELEVHFQPIVGLADGRLRGIEALVRWRHPDRGLVLPEDFVPLAEETGIILPIGRWVVVEAVQRARPWIELAPEADRFISVNVSIRQLQDPSFADHIDQVLRANGLAATHLVLDIREKDLLEPGTSVLASLAALRRLGVRIALDDFGGAQSQLGNLPGLPIDQVKIDRSFVAGMLPPGSSAPLAEAVVGVARALGVPIVAEGIETAEQLAMLQAMGCELGQGHLYSPALPADVLAPLVARGVFPVRSSAQTGPSQVPGGGLSAARPAGLRQAEGGEAGEPGPTPEGRARQHRSVSRA